VKKKQRKNKQQRRKSKKTDEREMGQATTSQGVNVPKEETRGNSLMGRAQ
jgi:hypothetical protein